MMKNKGLYWLLLLAAVFVVSCSDSDDPEPPVVIPDPDPLELPANLNVALVTYKSAVVTWKGDTNAVYYDVLVDGKDTISLRGTSCGIDNLDSEKSYNWQVRARRGEEATAWVNGGTFTTTVFADSRDSWVGTWYSQDWDAILSFVGVSIAYEEFIPELPEDTDINELLKLLEFNIDKYGDDPKGEDIRVTIPLLDAFLPEDTFVLPIIEDQFWFETSLSDTLNIVSEPITVGEFPLLGEIGGIGDLLSEDLVINNIKIVFNRLMVVFGPFEHSDGTIPLTGTLTGLVLIDTSSDLVDGLISAVKPDVKLTVTSTLLRKE